MNNKYTTTQFKNSEGILISFDAASRGDLNKAKEYYKGVFEYIGSGNIVYYNGVKNIENEISHFFKRI